MLNNPDNIDSVIALAGQMSGAFEGGTRDNGDKFRRLKDDSPEWMSDVNHAAHKGGDIWPLDWIYDKAESAVDHIARLDNIPGALDDAAHEYADSNADIYNAQLAHWLSLNVWFGEYVDDAVRDMGVPDGGIYNMIQAGQYLFLRDMFADILAALESVAEDMPEEESA